MIVVEPVENPVPAPLPDEPPSAPPAEEPAQGLVLAWRPSWRPDRDDLGRVRVALGGERLRAHAAGDPVGQRGHRDVPRRHGAPSVATILERVGRAVPGNELPDGAVAHRYPPRHAPIG